MSFSWLPSLSPGDKIRDFVFPSSQDGWPPNSCAPTCSCSGADQGCSRVTVGCSSSAWPRPKRFATLSCPAGMPAWRLRGCCCRSVPNRHIDTWGRPRHKKISSLVPLVDVQCEDRSAWKAMKKNKETHSKFSWNKFATSLWFQNQTGLIMLIKPHQHCHLMWRIYLLPGLENRALSMVAKLYGDIYM